MTVMIGEQAVQVKKCPTEKCNMYFEEGQGWVLPLEAAYQKVRGTSVNKLHPLTRSEVLELEVCKGCKFELAQRLSEGLWMHPTYATLKVMEGWISYNATALQREQEKKEKREAAQKTADLTLMSINATAGEDKGFVRRTFAETGVKHGYKGKKKHRQYKGAPKPPHNPHAPKKFGDEGHRHQPKAEDTKKKGKKQKDDKKQKQ